MKEQETNYEFDYSKLRGRIKEILGTQEKYAEMLGIGRTSLSLRLNGKTNFTQCEILASCYILKIDVSKIDEYFFTTKV